MANPIRIIYNSQRDNSPFAGLPGSSQCGYASASMMLSAFLPDTSSDEFVKNLILRMEPAYGQADLDDEILEEIPWARGQRLGMYGDAYAVACEEILQERGVRAHLQWRPTAGTTDELEAAIQECGSPAMLSTKITVSGHYICVVGFDAEHWICHDPYGNGYLGYRAYQDGAFVKYPRAWLESRAIPSDPHKKGLRFMYIKPE